MPEVALTSATGPLGDGRLFSSIDLAAIDRRQDALQLRERAPS
ncbi:MAG TPA: hypothetical protein VD758_12840 [Gemmatimonadaceae bacterium]|nr:hypothetical protein [Gemmatimonadaceae bacterium]